MFTGLRAIVQQIGESITDGRETDLDFASIGRLVTRNREPVFHFSTEFYINEGVEPPSGAVAGLEKSAPSFSKRAPEEAKSLGISGNQMRGGTPVPKQAPPPTPPVAYDEMPMASIVEEPDGQNFYESLDQGPPQSLNASASMPNLGDDERRRTPLLTSQQIKREHAYKEAMDRHIGEMETRAAEAVEERDAWHSHVVGCLHQEREDIMDKRDRARQNQVFLQQQMNWGEKRRMNQRREDIEAASSHDFPKFTEPPEKELKDFMHGQQARMRADLDEQVRTNNTLRNLSKQKERSLEISQIEANRQEMALLRDAERAKKAYDREAMATAWNADIRMKNIWKAIESHNKTGSHAPGALNPDSIPPSRGGSVRSVGRMMTGSSRKVPLGSSVSLSKLQGMA